MRAFERADDPSVTVLDVGSTNLILADEDETSHDAIARMLRHDVGRLPVVDRANKKRAVGILAAPVLWQRARGTFERECNLYVRMRVQW